MTVVWSDAALDRFSDIYAGLHLFEQRALVETYHRINRELADGPAGLGESREDDIRVWITGPLVVYFRLVPGGVVQVGHVKENKPAGG